MVDCFICNLLKQEKIDNLIMENEHAIVTFIDETREGQCLISTKKHRRRMSDMDPEEWAGVGEIINKVSRALEKKYNTEKTYLLCISDRVEHIHFHIIPKHKDLVSMGHYCFANVWEEEGRRETSDTEKKAMAEELRGMVEGG